MAKQKKRAIETEYAPNHPVVINWGKAKATLRDFVKRNRKVLVEACRGAGKDRTDSMTYSE
jgi:hypothetical protein